jgi:NAD(P)-dependent dehydrogenase (short-subunit alcohol dehydrogenase family)
MPARRIAGIRVAYNQNQTTNVQMISASTGVKMFQAIADAFLLGSGGSIAYPPPSCPPVRDGGTAEVLVMDVTNDASVLAAIASLEAGGPCDVLVNNAGTCNQGSSCCKPPPRAVPRWS